MLVLCNQRKQRHVDLRWMTSVLGVMIQSHWHSVSEGSPSQLPVIISFPAHVTGILKVLYKTSWNIEATLMEVPEAGSTSFVQSEKFKMNEKAENLPRTRELPDLLKESIVNPLAKCIKSVY